MIGNRCLPVLFIFLAWQCLKLEIIKQVPLALALLLFFVGLGWAIIYCLTANNDGRIFTEPKIFRLGASTQ